MTALQECARNLLIARMHRRRYSDTRRWKLECSGPLTQSAEHGHCFVGPKKIVSSGVHDLIKKFRTRSSSPNETKLSGGWPVFYQWCHTANYMCPCSVRRRASARRGLPFQTARLRNQQYNTCESILAGRIVAIRSMRVFTSNRFRVYINGDGDIFAYK